MSGGLTAGGAVQRALLAPATVGIALLAIAVPSAYADTFTVRNTADTGADSLRRAITQANDNTGPDAIRFRIPDPGVQTIRPESPLPAITDPVIVNGYSQPGTSPNTRATGNDAVLLIQLNGVDAGDTAAGLRVDADDSTIRGLVINRFGGDGIRIPGTSRNSVVGNFIGTNAAGTAALGNGVGDSNGDGVEISNGSDNAVGGQTAADRNLISGNQGRGVLIIGSPSTENRVLGNLVGTDASGTVDLGNEDGGVFLLSGAEGNTVGGTASQSRNVISGNDDDGVRISLGPGNVVSANFIVTTATGTVAVGNSGAGVEISLANDTAVGGTTAGERNVISGNAGDGVLIVGPDSAGNEVTGNYIGINANFAALGNRDGVVIVNGADDNTVGGPAGSGNRIAHNEGSGVRLSGPSVGNSILHNSIFSNADLGIDLASDGVTANDVDDFDETFPPPSNNRLQNFPVIESAVRNPSTGVTRISGSLNSNRNARFRIQCFVAAPDPSDHGEGRRLVGLATAATDANGDDDSWVCTDTTFPDVGQQVTATATRTATGDTSEFSENETVVSGP